MSSFLSDCIFKVKNYPNPPTPIRDKYFVNDKELGYVDFNFLRDTVTCRGGHLETVAMYTIFEFEEENLVQCRIIKYKASFNHV